VERQTFIERFGTVLLLTVIYAVGILGHSLENFLPLMKDLTPLVLLISIVVVIWFTREDWNKKVIIWAVSTFLITFILEAVGVSTGVIFGHYTYGETLGPGLFNVPIMIGLNWVIIIYSIVSILTKVTDNLLAFVFLAGSATVAFDFVMEPIAIHLNYWNWQNEVIPLQNYIAWFVISSLAALAYFFLKQKPQKDLPIYLVIIQLVFFLLLDIILVK
jgi:putative membrane protein